VAIKYITVSAIAAALGAAALVYMQKGTPAPTHVYIGDTILPVEVAATEEARNRGLSGRGSLTEGSGMLFVFEVDNYWGIWMKDMRFSIDIVWLAKDGTIVTVAPEVSPATFPRSFLPQAPARYVLELPAGAAAHYGIAEGGHIVVK
jgi:uncharacterized protein